jgi:hypothetical protein
MQLVYYETQYPNLFSDKWFAELSTVDEAKIMAEVDLQKGKLERKAFTDQLDETEFYHKVEQLLKEANDYELTLKTHLKSGELRSIAKECLKAVKEECEANGVTSAKTFRTTYVRDKVSDLVETLRKRLEDANELASYKAAVKGARESREKGEWPAHVVRRGG